MTASPWSPGAAQGSARRWPAPSPGLVPASCWWPGRRPHSTRRLTRSGQLAAQRAASAPTGDRAGADRACDLVGAVSGHPDILINAAGVNIRPPLAELTQADWDRSLEVNLTAPFLLGQQFGPAMAARGWGRIINVASQQAIRAF